MVQPRDITVLLALARAPKAWTVRSLGELIGEGPANVHRSLGRLAKVGLYSPALRRVNAAVLDEFIRHGLRFVDVRELGAERRGFATAWSVEPLRSEIWSDGNPPVWPSSRGPVRGPSLEPLTPRAVALLNDAPDIATDLALIDAIRVGRARERSRAADYLSDRLLEAIA